MSLFYGSLCTSQLQELVFVVRLCVQLLAQMGLAGQTLFANSDGTISVDGSLLTIQGRPVQLASQ